eukprot:jgi/Picre1/35280/NNA_002742.t1
MVHDSRVAGNVSLEDYYKSVVLDTDATKHAILVRHDEFEMLMNDGKPQKFVMLKLRVLLNQLDLPFERYLLVEEALHAIESSCTQLRSIHKSNFPTSFSLVITGFVMMWIIFLPFDIFASHDWYNDDITRATLTLWCWYVAIALFLFSLLLISLDEVINQLQNPFPSLPLRDAAIKAGAHMRRAVADVRRVSSLNESFAKILPCSRALLCIYYLFGIFFKSLSVFIPVFGAIICLELDWIQNIPVAPCLLYRDDSQTQQTIITKKRNNNNNTSDRDGMGENPMSSEKNISAGKVEKSTLSGGEEATDKKKKNKKHSRRWKDSIKAEECRVSASGVEAFGSKDVHESHGFVLSGLLPGQQAGEIARTGYIVSMKRWMKAYVTGFTRQQYVRALQTFIAYVIFMCIVSPDAVNSALWYNGIMPPELGLIYVLMISVLGGTVGTNSVMQIYALVSLVVAGLFGVLIRYIVWLASGEDWDNNDFAKGAAFSLLIAFSCGCFNILRWKWDATNAFFFMCSIFLIFTQGPYYGPQAGTLYLTAVYTLINIALATMIYTLVSWFVLPMYSCQAMRASTAKAIEGIGSAIMAERDLIMSPVDPESGLFQEATGERDPLTGRDCGLFPKCEKIADVMRASRGLLLNNKGLRLPSLLEIDVYHQTGQYIFPVVPYVHVEYYCHIVLAMLSNLARPIKTGTLNMRMFQNKDIRGAFDELMESFRDVAEALAHCINNPKVTPWEDVEHVIESSHDRWIEFLRAGQQAMKMGGNADESFAVKSISIFLYNTGTP